MNKKDYSKISTKKILKSKKDKKVEETEEKKNVVEEVPEKVESKEKTGIVNCGKLNVRTEPKKDVEVLTILSKNDVVKILDDSNDEFYKVMISNGTEGHEGYCMKKFIDIK